MPHEQPAVNRRSKLLIALSLFVVALASRCYRLEGQSLWNDEMFSLELARSSLPVLLQKLATYYHHPPLFFVLIHALYRMLGDSVWVLRCISALAGSCTVVGVYLLGRKLFGEVAGVAAGLLCLCSPFHLAYSQEGRPYALAGLLALATCYLMVEYLQSPKRLLMQLYVLATIALLYTHYWGLFVSAGQAIFISSFPLSRNVKKAFLIGWVIVGALFAPMVPMLFVQSSAEHAGGWWWVESPSVSELMNVLRAYSGVAFKMASGSFEQLPAIQVAGVATIVVLLASAAAMTIVKRLDVRIQALAAASCLSFALPFLMSFYRPEAFIWYRHTVILFPVICVLVCGVAAHQRWRTATRLILGILIVVGIIGSMKYYSWSKSNVRDVAGYVDLVTRDSVQLVIRPANFAPLLNYYYHGSAIQLDEAYLDQPLGRVVDTARAFVYISLDVPNEIREYMDSHFTRISERVFPGEAHMGMVVGVYSQAGGVSGEK